MCEIGSCGAASNGLLIKPRFVAAHDGRGVLLFTPIAPRKSIKKRDRESCDRTPTILIKAGDREALDMWAKAMRSRAAHEDDAADRANEPQAPGPKSVDAAKIDVNRSRPAGNSRTRAIVCEPKVKAPRKSKGFTRWRPSH
jgi:hypothetical protein